MYIALELNCFHIDLFNANGAIGPLSKNLSNCVPVKKY